MNMMYRYVQPAVSSSNLLGSSTGKPAIHKGLRIFLVELLLPHAPTKSRFL